MNFELDSARCSTLALNCFDGGKFFKFLFGVVIFPYVLYLFVATHLGWTRKRKKTPTQHFESIVRALSSATLLWLLGNYEETFDKITFTFTIIGILLFGFVAEKLKDTHEHTLATMHKWNGSMKTVVFIVLLALAAVAVHHIHLATEISEEFRNVYVLCGFIPVFLVYLATKTAEMENRRNEGTKLLFHLHHVHLFYALAFFTRFPEFFSRVAAGLFLGASLHGAAAFENDRSFDRIY